jgi:adhesin HecA-like repeat protein
MKTSFRTMPSSFHFLLFIFVLLIPLNFFTPGHALSAVVTIQWDSSDSATGYKLHYGSESASYDVIEDVGSSLQHTIADLYDNQNYYFAVTAYNEYGESTYSDELVYLTPITAVNQPPTIEAGADKMTTLPDNSVLLDGTVTDDGLPNPPGTTSTTWSQLNGPATVSFDNPANVSTSATFPVAGTYVLHLQAADGSLSAGDELTITVYPEIVNQAPGVSAGSDQTITLPDNSVLLDGSVTDDGLPNPPGTTSTAWSQLSGPATVSFDNPANVDTRATFSVAGTYVLHLQAADGSLSAGDELTITVYPEIVNQAPGVSAGSDQTITLPDNSVLLDGSVTDDGLPNPPGSTITTWSQVSGPAAVSFDDTSEIGTWASFPDAGTYVLNLEADDGESIVSDEVTITVNDTAAGPYLEQGVVRDVSNGDWTTVTLTQYYTSMVVVCTPNYDSTSPPVIVRVDGVEGDSFRVRVDRTDGATALIEGISIHYMVVEQGVYTEADHGVKMEAVKFLSTITDENNSWVGRSMPYSNSYANPVILGQVMTYNDPRFSTFWSCGSSRSAPPDSSNLKVGKTVSEDPDNIRFDEVIGYIVIEAGSGDIEGIKYAAAIGNDSVRGVDDTPPYNYTPNALFTPEVAIASQSAMDGGNGGWAVLYGDNPVSADMLNLAIDEDQSGDSERAHTTEQVAYVVFEQSGEPPLLSLPSPASQPDPADGATQVNTSPVLSWTAGSGTVFHDVYFGISSSPLFIGSQDGSTFDPGTLDEETTYFWRIDENGEEGITPGTVWSFTTGSDSEPLWVQLSYDDFESGWGSFTDGGGDCSLYSYGTYAYQGNKAGNIQDNNGTASSFFYAMGIDTDTPGFTQLEIDFWFKAISMDNSKEDFLVQYYDGSTWHTVASYAAGVDFENGVFYNQQVYIDESSYIFPPDMKIRFMCDASSNRDDVYIDEVRVSAR